MTLSAVAAGIDPLAPVRASLGAMAARQGAPALTGIAPGLTLTDTTGWVPATALTSGERVDEFLETAQQRWDAAPHAAAALAWKSYTYWLALPAVLGYAAARRVPLVRPGNVAVRWSPRPPFLVVGLTATQTAALPRDPLAVARAPAVAVLRDEEELLAALRTTVMDEHLVPLLDQIQARLHIGRRTLWGSLASGVAHGLSRAADTLPGPTIVTARQILGVLGVADLVDLAPRGHNAGLDVQRRTCCLAFTLPEPKICTGCCIRRNDTPAAPAA